MVAVSPIQRLRGQDVRVEAGCLRGRLPSMVTWNCAPARQRSVRRRNVIVGGRWQAMPSVVSWIKGPPSPVLAPVVAPAEHAGACFHQSAQGTWAGNEALVSRIIEMLPASNRMKTRGVCKEWRDMVDDPLIWQVATVGVLPYGEQEMAQTTKRNRSTQTDHDGTANAALAHGLRRLARRCFSRTYSLTMPCLPTDDLESILTSAPSLTALHVYVSEQEYMTTNENGLVAIARSCRKLESLRHPLPPLHFDSDERLHRSSLRLVMKSNPDITCLDFSLPAPGEDVMVHRLVDALHHAPALTELSVRNCSNVDDRIIRPLCARPLCRLDVRGTSVTYRALELLAANCLTLKAIAVDPPCGDERNNEISEKLWLLIDSQLF